MATTLQQLGASEIDTKLAPYQFCERLCLIKTSPNTDFAFTPGRAGPDQTVSVNKLWPALKFNTYNDLIGQLKFNVRIKGKFAVAANNLAREAGLSLAQAGFAYLLGKGNNSSNFLIVLKKNDSGDIIDEGVIFDFFDSMIEMESPEGYCSSPEFQYAFKIAMARLEMSEAVIGENGEDVMPVQVTTVNSAKKTLGPVAEADQLQGMGQANTKHEESPRRTSPRKKQRDEQLDVPVESVEFSGKEANASDTSSIGAENVEEELVEDEPIGRKSPKGIRATPVADGSMDWTQMWTNMRKEGWTWIPGDGLVDWYYIHPNFAKRGKTEILNKGKEGSDYFINEESVMRYAKQYLGFRGRVATPASVNNEMKVRGVERRGRKRTAAAVVTSEAAVETKEKKQKKKISRAGKKQVAKKSDAGKKHANASKWKEENKNTWSSNDSESHFSLGAFHPSSPTLSDAEIDIGVKAAQKKLTYNAKPKHNINSAQDTAEEKSECSESGYENFAETESESSDGTESEDDTFQVLASLDAWKLLMDHFGFKYHKGMYCLPGAENKPGEESSAIEGRHYFPTLMELRKHLCAYGLPKRTAYLEYRGLAAIDRWVRFANVKGLPDAAFVNPADVGGYLNFRDAWSMLQKLGLTWCGGHYIVDDPDPKKESKRFENLEDMSKHLARFGIPNIRNSANVGLTEDDRLRLDLYIANAEIDSFKRIDPDKENVNEITPRRSRSKSSVEAAESSKDSENLLQRSPTEPKQALGHREYQTTFNKLETQRQMNLSQIDDMYAYQLLAEHYNFSQSTSYDEKNYGSSYFCFPEAGPTEKFKLGVDYFESLQDMREYLCAYGLPPRAKRTRISDSDMVELEQWIRCAHIKEPYDERATTSVRMKPKEVKSILKGLGYRFIKHFDFYLLPGTSCHKSQVGKDRFEQLIDLFNHIARFGLCSNGDGCTFSAVELQRLQLFIASIATYDLSNRIECRESLPKQAPIPLMKTSSVAAKQSEPDHIASEVDIKTPKHVPVVMDQEDTPEQQQKTPPKQKGIMNYFAKTVAEGVSSVIKAALTPSNHHSVQNEVDMNASSRRHGSNDAAISNSISSTLEGTSPPSVKETAVDEEFEASVQDPAQYVEKKDAYTLSKRQIHLPWSELFKEMKSGGWGHKAGNDFVDYYYIHPHCVGMKKSEVLKLQKGIDYFESEDEVRLFAKEHLGWKGEKLYSTPGESMISTPVISAGSNKRSERNITHEEASPSKKSRTHRQYPDRFNKAPSSASTKQSKSHIPLCDQVFSYKDKLEYCKLTLHPSYALKNERLSTTSNSVVAQLESEIKRFMMRAMETGYDIDGMNAQSPGFMYICGGPGTGKTTAVAACSQQLTKWANDIGVTKPRYCHINMASAASMGTDGIKKHMLKEMAKKLGIEKNTDLPTFVNQFKAKGMILVVDEIDMLFKNHGGSTEEWFTTLIEWCEDKELPFSMIGISNSVNDVNATKIRELSNTPHELVFPTYNEADLLAILEKRIGTKIVDPKALQLIAKRVAASTGDARKALEITYNAVDKSLDSFSEKWEEDVQDDDYPLVKLPQMMRAIREGMPTRHEEIIRGLPQAAKVILCIAVSLGKVWGPTAAVSIATLKRYAVQATQHAMLDDASLGQITNLVEMLMDSGLLTTDHDGCFNFNANDPTSRLHIGVQLDDVEIALEKSLLEESSFYRSLVDYIKRECPRPE